MEFLNAKHNFQRFCLDHRVILLTCWETAGCIRDWFFLTVIRNIWQDCSKTIWWGVDSHPSWFIRVIVGHQRRVTEQFFQLFEGYLAGLSPGCIEQQQVIQRVDKDWHIGNEFTIIIHQPQENFRCVAFCGSGTSWMAFTLHGEGWIPYRSTMNAKYSTEGFINTHFGSFNFIRMLFPGCEDAVCRLDQLRFSNPGYHQLH